MARKKRDQNKRFFNGGVSGINLAFGDRFGMQQFLKNRSLSEKEQTLLKTKLKNLKLPIENKEQDG